MNEPTGPKLQERTQQHLNQVVAELRKNQRDELVQTLSEVVGSKRSLTPLLVVVGETKRGKSSLINALLERPGLSPVDVDVATSTCLVFHYAADDTSRVRLASSGAIEDIPFDEIAEWATVEGNPGNARGVHSVLIGLDRPLLRLMTIIDTPGVGGLEAGHGAFAAQAASTADALLFVIDADAPISEPELNFLHDVAGQVDNLTVVLTKRDYPDWQVIAADDSRLLAARDSRLGGLPLMSASSTVALDPRTWAESGLPELTAHLTEQIGARSDVLRYANFIRVAATCIEELARTLSTRRAALNSATGTLAALQGERARLDSMKTDPKARIRTLDSELRRLTHDRGDKLSRAMRELRLEYDDRASSAKGEDLEALPGELLSDVTAVSDRLSIEIQDRLVELMLDLIADIDSSAPELASLEQLFSKQLQETITLDTPRKRAANRMERLSTVISFSSGRSIGSLVASLPVFALGGAPFMIAGLGLGAFFAFQMHRGRSDVVRQNDFKNWMREQLQEAERQLNNDFSRAMIDINAELRDELADRLDARRNQIQELITACEANLAREKAEREREVEVIDGQLRALHALASANEQLRADLLADGAVREVPSTSSEVLAVEAASQ